MIEKIDRKEALRYLGYGSSPPDELVSTIMDESEPSLLEVMHPRYVYRVLEIREISDRVYFKDTAMSLAGENIAGLLAGCESAVVFAMTLSAQVDEHIRRAQVLSMTKAVVINAMVNAAAEQVCDLIQNEISSTLGKKQTRRFSPGYGDFPLESQPEILRLLDAGKRIGLSLNSSLLMSPEKSVTAVFGLFEPNKTGSSGSVQLHESKINACSGCKSQADCAYKK